MSLNLFIRAHDSVICLKYLTLFQFVTMKLVVLNKYRTDKFCKAKKELITIFPLKFSRNAGLACWLIFFHIYFFNFEDIGYMNKHENID